MPTDSPDIVPTMSEPAARPTTSATTASARGQSFVEFALVLPMLLVLLLGIADFGRIFSAAIALEAAARNAAEVGALERLRNRPPADTSQHAAYYENLHAIAAAAACGDMEVVPPPKDYAAGTDCSHLSAVRVCVHDNGDVECGEPIPGYDAAVPAGCTDLLAAPTPWASLSGGEIGSHWVEVHACYQFTTLFDLNLSLPMNTGLALGDIYLQHARSFVIDCPPGDPTSC